MRMPFDMVQQAHYDTIGDSRYCQAELAEFVGLPRQSP